MMAMKTGESLTKEKLRRIFGVVTHKQELKTIGRQNDTQGGGDWG